MIRRNVKVGSVRNAAALLLVVLGAACSPASDEKAANPEQIILKCEGASIVTTVVSGGARTAPPKPMQTSFRIQPDYGSIEMWREGKFEPLCEKAKCLEATRESFSVFHKLKGEPKSHHKEGITKVNVDRITGKATYNFMNFYDGLITEVNFDGQCEKSTVEEISRSKF